MNSSPLPLPHLHIHLAVLSSCFQILYFHNGIHKNCLLPPTFINLNPVLISLLLLQCSLMILRTSISSKDSFHYKDQEDVCERKHWGKKFKTKQLTFVTPRPSNGLRGFLRVLGDGIAGQKRSCTFLSSCLWSELSSVSERLSPPVIRPGFVST